MQAQKPNTKDKVTENQESPERERLRDIIIVIVSYPITPTEKAEELLEHKPWLEVLSLVLKVVLSGLALFELFAGQ